MKTVYYITAFILAATSGHADSLSDRIEQVNREDQRAVAGTLNTQTGIMTITTQDMAEGKPGKGLSPRTFDVDLSALQGRHGTDGSNGADGINGTDAHVDYAAMLSIDAAVAGLGSLNIVEPLTGGWSYAVNASGVFTDLGNQGALSAGLAFGFADGVTGTVKVSADLDMQAVTFSVGVSGRF